MDYESLRKEMVLTQLIPRGIRDPRVLEVMSRVPRHLFVGERAMSRAYDDAALPTSDGQTISQPYMVAVMTELLTLRGNEKVLEIGTGSGYQAAVLSELSKEVFTIERIAALAAKAVEKFDAMKYTNIHVMTGDGTLGWPGEAPFDRIIITAGAPEIPKPLIDQLAPEGIIVVPVGDPYSQRLIRATKSAGGLKKEFHTPCVFVPLVGKFGWGEDK
ncbi:MAG: protein-L-isoaspartate(D-aspartate) O-methyltransferase [Nitrospirae bacterium]|nr:protein-L-isoaspartate(D-aspartate) O-methyltransferase [Nitrospirota bacterium]